MTEFLQIWQIILKSNLFNFVLMLIFLGWIIKKFKIADLLESGRQQIENSILNAKKEKELSEKELTATQSETKKVETKAQNIIKQSEENAKMVGESLIESAHKQAETYTQSTNKTIDNTIKNLRTYLTNETAQISLDRAKTHIQNLLKNDRELHLRYINESIESLKEVKI